jgi:hypothetical protein
VRVPALLTAFLLSAPLVAAETEAWWPEGATNPYGHVPVRVFIDTANLTTQTARYADEVRAAWVWWENGGNGRLSWSVRFQEVRERTRADILVWFVEADHVLCSDGEAGSGCGGFGVPGSFPGVVYFATLDGYPPPASEGRLQLGPSEVPRPRQHIPFDVMRSVAKHEFGHALGFDHAQDPADIMHPGWEDFHTEGDRPESLLMRAEVMGYLGLGLGVLAVAAGGIYVRHRWLDAIGRRRVRQLEEGTADRCARPARAAPVPKEAQVATSGYLKNVPCPEGQNGEHTFDVRTTSGETWLVCRACRLPKRL